MPDFQYNTLFSIYDGVETTPKLHITRNPPRHEPIKKKCGMIRKGWNSWGK